MAKKEIPQEKPKRFLDVKKSLSGEYGENIFEIENVTRIPTGIFDLDCKIGGGIPECQPIILWGDKATSKTTTALRTVNNYLNIYQNMLAVFVDAEHTLTPDWRDCYISPKNLSRFHSINADYGEQAIDMAIESAKALDVGLIVVDSIAMMISVEEAIKSAFDDTMAANVKLVNKLFRKVIPIMSRAKKTNRKLTPILISQPTVDTRGSKQGIVKLIPIGGKKVGLLAGLEIYFKAGLYTRIGDKPYKVKHEFIIKKSKTSLPQWRGEYSMYLRDYGTFTRGQIDEFVQVMKAARNFGILQKEGKSGWKLDKIIFKSQEELFSTMRENEKLYSKVRQLALDAAVSSRLEDEGEEKDEKEGAEE